MSDTDNDARDRVSRNRPIENTGGQQVAADADDLWNGDVGNTIGYDQINIR